VNPEPRATPPKVPQPFVNPVPLTPVEPAALPFAQPQPQTQRDDCECEDPERKRKRPSNVIARVKGFARRMSQNSLDNLE